MDSLQRFLRAQETAFPQARAELQAGKKQTHWMWFIFPQLLGLGSSTLSTYYGIENREEARQYLAHPVLGGRLEELTTLLLEGGESDPRKIFGGVDAMKFCSCMTLFEAVAGTDSLFSRALDKFYDGRRDETTLKILEYLP